MGDALGYPQLWGSVLLFYMRKHRCAVRWLKQDAREVQTQQYGNTAPGRDVILRASSVQDINNME